MPEPKNQPEEERRQHQRRPIRIPVGIGHPEGQHACQTLNMSRSGICCLVDHPIPLFTKVQLDIVFGEAPEDDKDPSRVNCEGIVVRQDKRERPGEDQAAYETAIFFEDLPGEAAEEISRHIHADGT